MLTLSLLVAAAQAATPAPAPEPPLIPTFFTGERLYELCRQSQPGFCSMYVVGVLDGIFLSDQQNGRRTTCPTSLTNREAARIVTDYLGRNAAIRPRAASVGITRAMVERFPCAAA